MPRARRPPAVRSLRLPAGLLVVALLAGGPAAAQGQAAPGAARLTTSLQNLTGATVRTVTGVVQPPIRTLLGQAAPPVGGTQPLVTGVLQVVPQTLSTVNQAAQPLAGGLVGQTSSLVGGVLTGVGGLVDGVAGQTSSLATGPLSARPAAGVVYTAVSTTAPQPAKALGYSGGAGFSQMVALQLAAQSAQSAQAAGPTEAVGSGRAARLQALLAANRGLLESDGHGQPVLLGEILALSPSQASMAKAAALGFSVKSRADLADLGLSVVVLQAPPGLSAPDALNRLRRADPSGRYDFNHLYSDAGSVGAAAHAAGRPAGAARGRVGLIDSGFDARHPSLRGARIEQRGFAPGGISPRAHGLATASLLVGSEGRFRSAAPGASLFAADVYGATAAGGSAESIARALTWMAGEGVPVINVSLVGPDNATLRAVIGVLTSRGYLIVAAVGNDGPAAPALYPAAYPGVVAVTGVTAQRRVLPEAGRGTHVDFAAPGADMAAAGAGGYVAVRGTSFAAPLVAGRLSRAMTRPDPKAAARAMAALGAEASDLGDPGIDLVYGRGLVGADLMTSPTEVAARGALRGF